MNPRTEEAYVVVAMNPDTGRAVAVAIIEGAEGRTSLHRHHGDWASAELAAAESLQLIGLQASTGAIIAVRTEWTRASSAEFLEQVGHAFDGTFQKGVGSA